MQRRKTAESLETVTHTHTHIYLDLNKRNKNKYKKEDELRKSRSSFWHAWYKLKKKQKGRGILAENDIEKR